MLAAADGLTLGPGLGVTAGAVLGNFGARAKSRSERLLKAGLVHIVASDAHDVDRRPPQLGAAVNNAPNSLSI